MPFRICNIGILSIEKALMRTITINILVQETAKK